MTNCACSDIGGMLVHSVLKSNQIAQHVVADVKGNKPGGPPGSRALNGGREKSSLERLT